jgi:hypothetical protein
MPNKKSPYLSYLLRLWSTSGARPAVWRASLENPHTGERLGFSTLERLFSFLQDQCIEINEQEEPDYARRSQDSTRDCERTTR